MRAASRSVWIAVFSLLVGMLASVPARALSVEEINEAEWVKPIASFNGVDPVVAKVQILLDRAYFSPGAIDGQYGSNTRKALQAYQEQHGLSGTGTVDAETWEMLTENDPEPVLTRYTVVAKDVEGPFVESIPREMREMAKLERLAYTSPRELLAEKFHVSEAFLQSLNPGEKFDTAGTEIVVAAVRTRAFSGKVARITVDKRALTVTAYASDDRLLAFYPATIGSDRFPSPTGELKVTRVAENPVFTYSSKLSYSDLKEGEALNIAPGPNNPVGLVWIGLSAPGFGIHGSPEPSRISKQSSHGCVRLTNWDALELARRVSPGVPVQYVD